jgi:hypothetical protein
MEVVFVFGARGSIDGGTTLFIEWPINSRFVQYRTPSTALDPLQKSVTLPL